MRTENRSILMTDELEPGTELDDLVAEMVFGWTLCDPDCPPRDWGSWDEPPAVQHAIGTTPTGCRGYFPEYSTDVAAAWDVIERLRDLNILCHTQHRLDGTHIVSFFGPVRFHSASGWSQQISFPHAICLAALKAADALPTAAPPPN